MSSINCLIIGLNALGNCLARDLARRGTRVAVADIDPRRVGAIKDSVDEAVRLDAMNPDALETLRPLERSHVVVSIDHDFEVAQMASFHLLEVGVEHLIVVANTEERREILEKIGVHRVVTPGILQAQSLALQIADRAVDLYREVVLDHGVALVRLGKAQVLSEKRVRKWEKMGIRIVGYRLSSGSEATLDDAPTTIGVEPDAELPSGTELFVFGHTKSLADFTRKVR